MILAFHPTHPEIPGEDIPVPRAWSRFVFPWSVKSCRKHAFGSTLIQELLTDSFALFSWRLDVHEAIRLYPYSGKPTIALQFTLEGNIPCVLSGYGDKRLEKGNGEMFYVPIGYNEAWFEPGNYESLHIELQPHYLEELAAVHPEVRELVSRLQASSLKGRPMVAVPVQYITGAILRNLKACEKKGAALQLEMHKYILELLCEYLSGIWQKEEEERKMNRPHKDLMIRIRNHILSAPDIQEHSLKNLALQFSISQTLLKRNFKAFYGMNVSEYVRERVLERALYLLATTTDSIEEISVVVGYSSREALERSFRKRYGYTPSDLRSDLKG